MRECWKGSACLPVGREISGISRGERERAKRAFRTVGSQNEDTSQLDARSFIKDAETPFYGRCVLVLSIYFSLIYFSSVTTPRRSN